jgi:protein phosphatase
MSDVGCVRTVNEDYFLYCEPEADDEFVKRGRLILVADGMGGHNGGEVASGVAVETMRHVFLETEQGEANEILQQSFAQAHQAILDLASRMPELEGMGTTCSAAIIKDGLLSFGHIGDSRLYLLRDGQIVQLTEDHTLVNQLIKSGAISVSEAKRHHQRNVLTAALGATSANVSASFSDMPVPLEQNDVLLLCSDGLHGLLSDDEMFDLIDRQNLYMSCRSLVNKAKQCGGPDNITVQLLRVKEVHG